LSPEYAEIARARIAHWEAERGLTREEAEHRDMRGESSRGEQLALFGGRG